MFHKCTHICNKGDHLYIAYPSLERLLLKEKKCRKAQAEQRCSLAAGVPLRVSLAGVCGSPDSTNGCGREVCAGVAWWWRAGVCLNCKLWEDWSCHWAHSPGGWDFIHQRWPQGKGTRQGFCITFSDTPKIVQLNCIQKREVVCLLAGLIVDVSCREFLTDTKKEDECEIRMDSC